MRRVVWLIPIALVLALAPLALPPFAMTLLTEAVILGLFAMMAVSVVLMMAVLAGVLRLAGYGVSSSVAVAALLILLELALMAAAALLFGSFTKPILASAFSLSLFLVGHLLSDLKAFQQRSQSELAKALTGWSFPITAAASSTARPPPPPPCPPSRTPSLAGSRSSSMAASPAAPTS